MQTAQMTAAERRERIMQTLSRAANPVSAGALAAAMGVSRQIVVGDVALLRAGGAEIEATARGYKLKKAEEGFAGIVACAHSTAEQMRQELYTVVDNGAAVVDVAVENALYGEIRGNLNITSRYEADCFMREAESSPESLLSRMTGGVHLHTLRCPDEQTFERVKAELEKRGILYGRD